MTHFGKIKSYDSSAGTGSIYPESGGDALQFRKADLQEEGEVPKIDQRYSYNTREFDGGKKSAINLQHQQSQEEQARNQQG
ncbi:cold-shock protein [Erythrobacter sp. HA6-11]